MLTDISTAQLVQGCFCFHSDIPQCATGRKRNFWVLSYRIFLSANANAEYRFCMHHWKTWLRIQTWGIGIIYLFILLWAKIGTGLPRDIAQPNSPTQWRVTWSKLLRAMSNWALSIAEDGDSIICKGVFQPQLFCDSLWYIDLP